MADTSRTAQDGGAHRLMAEPRFAGRADELHRVREALERPPSLVLICGEAGMGKTRLVREVLSVESLACRNPLVAACPPYRRPYTLSGITEALHRRGDLSIDRQLSSFASRLRPLFPDWPSSPPTMRNSASDAGEIRHQVYADLARLLPELRVGILVVEDVHWADDATVEFLLYLAHLGSPKLGVAVTCRREEVPKASLWARLASSRPGVTATTRVDLSPVDIGATADIASSLVGDRPIPESLVTVLHRVTAGVPLSIEESVRMLESQGPRFNAGDSDAHVAAFDWLFHKLAALEVPPAIRDTVEERVRRMSAPCRQILEACSVIADSTTVALLRDVTAMSKPLVDGGLEEAIERAILEASDAGRVQFRHVLVGRAIYDSIAAPRRVHLHARTASALQTHEPTALSAMAHHFRRAGNTPGWVKYGERAADSALAVGDSATATTLLGALVEAPGVDPMSIARIASKIPFGSYIDTPVWRSVDHVLRQLLRRRDVQRPVEGMLRFCLGGVLVGAHEYDRAQAEFERCVQLLPRDSTDRFRALFYLAMPIDRTKPLPAHLAWGRRALSEPIRMPNTAARLGREIDRTMILLNLGDASGWVKADRIPDTAPLEGEWLQVVRGNLNLGDAAITWGYYGESRRRLTAALAHASSWRNERFMRVVQGTLLRLDWLTGAWTSLADRAREMVDEDTDRTQVWGLEARVVLGRIVAANGDFAQAERCFREVVAMGERFAPAYRLLEPIGQFTSALVEAGDSAKAIAASQDAVDMSVRKQLWLYATELVPPRVEALIREGSSIEARTLVDGFAKGVASCAAPATRAALLHSQGSLLEGQGRFCAAADAYAAAAKRWKALPRPYDAALAAARSAICQLSVHNDEGDAEERLNSAYNALAKLGADAAAGRLVCEMRKRGIRPPRALRMERGYGDALSPREIEVVALVAAGHTNREVAVELHRSPRTIETQLQSAMRKLNATTRTEVAVRAVVDGYIHIRPEQIGR